MAIKDNFGNPQGCIGMLMLIGMNKGHTPMAKWAFNQFEVPNQGKLLDIGCGGGYNLKRLLKKSKNATVYGVDISQTSVNKSKAVNKKYLNSRCEVYKANANSLPFVDNSINLITAFETVYFWKDMDKCFAEIYRVLDFGAQFIIINDPGNPNKHWDEMIPDMTVWSVTQLENFMTNAGFKNIKTTKNKYKICIIGIK